MKTSGDIDLTEGYCFRATPLFSQGNYLTLRTIRQEKTKEFLEDIIDDIFTPDALLPPRKKPSFKPGDWWALRSKDASWERVQVCKEPWKKPIDCTVGNGVVVDRHGLEVKLHRSDPDLQKIPNDKVHLITDIPPICYTVIVDPTFKPNIQLVGSLPDLVRAGTEIMCMVRRIDAETMLPVVVWYPSTEMRHFERRVALDSSPASFQPNITPVEGEAADVFVVWLTAEKSARFTYSVVFGNATSVNENAPFFRFQKQLLEVQRIASECAPWDWRRGAPAVGAKLLYECDGVRSNIQKMGPAWVRAVVSSVHFDASQSSWQVVVSLLDMGDRKVVITGQHLFTRLRVWCHQLDKFDSQPPLVVVTCRLQGYETNADMRMDKEGFAFMQHLNDSVAFFMRREVDGGGDVVYETVMWGTDWRRKNVDENPYVDVGQLLCSVDLATNVNDRREVSAEENISCRKIDARLQFPIASDPLLGWPQNPLLSNRVHAVQVLRAEAPHDLLLQILTDDSRRMIRTLNALYKCNSALLKNVSLADLPLEKQFACVVHLSLNESATYSDGIFPLYCDKDGVVFVRAMVIRRKFWEEQSVQFYAIDFDLAGKVPITAVYYLFDLAPLRIPPTSVQCRLNVNNQPIDAKGFKTFMMSDEFHAIFGPPTATPMESRRCVWLLRRDGVSLDDELIEHNGLQSRDEAVDAASFPVHLITEDFERTTAKLTGRYLYEVICPDFGDNNGADGVYNFELVDLQPMHKGRNVTRFLPNSFLRSRIEGLHSTARSLLSKLPLCYEELSEHLHLTPMISPVSSTMEGDELVYSSRLFLGLSNDKRYDVIAMLTAWEDVGKWSEEHERLIVRENRFDGACDLFYPDAQWPAPLGTRLLASVIICRTTPNVVFLRPADWLRWERVVFNRCQELYQSGQAKPMQLEDLTSGEGMACLALWPKDGNLYRAEIVGMKGGPTVLFVDYGNQAKNVSMADLFIPPPDLLAIPKLVFHVQELDYAPPNNAVAWSALGERTYEEAVGSMTVVEMRKRLPYGIYDGMLYMPTHGDDRVASNVRVMEKLHFEQMCCEKVDVDERRRHIALASDLTFISRWPRTTPPAPESLPTYIRAVTFVTSPHQLYVVAKGSYHDSWLAMETSLSKELLMTHIAPDRVWPGRLVAAPYFGSFYRAVVLSVDKVTGCVDVAYIDWGNRRSVRLNALVELSPALILNQPCNLMRLKLDDVIDDSLATQFNDVTTDKLSEWLTAKVGDEARMNSREELRALCKRRNDLEGVPEFVVGVKCDDCIDCWSEVSGACPKSSSRIRKTGVEVSF